MALLGKSSEEVFIEALRGCNQHKHKPGCPDADGGEKEGFADAEDFLEKARAAYKNKNLSDFVRDTKWDRTVKLNHGDMFFKTINGTEYALVKNAPGHGADYIAGPSLTEDFLDEYLYKTPQQLADQEGISVQEAFDKYLNRKKELGQL